MFLQLNEVKQRNIAEIDKQLDSLQEEVRKQPIENTENMKKELSRLSSSNDIQMYEENEMKSAEALKKLTDMSML